MAYALSWVAVRTAAPQPVQDTLGLRGTGERKDMAESEITAAALPNGWYLVVSNHDKFELKTSWFLAHWIRDKLKLESDEMLSSLSQVGEVVMCSVEGHVMYSSAACRRDGQRVWAVSHLGDRDLENLDVKGEPPASFAAIRDRLCAQQAAEGGDEPEVDYIFEIPVELALSITGYRHDADMPDNAFEVLAMTKPEPSGWRRFFGRRS